jgi:hypothetical protein
VEEMGATAMHKARHVILGHSDSALALAVSGRRLFRCVAGIACVGAWGGLAVRLDHLIYMDIHMWKPPYHTTMTTTTAGRRTGRSGCGTSRTSRSTTYCSAPTRVRVRGGEYIIHAGTYQCTHMHA